MAKQRKTPEDPAGAKQEQRPSAWKSFPTVARTVTDSWNNIERSRELMKVSDAAALRRRKSLISN